MTCDGEGWEGRALITNSDLQSGNFLEHLGPTGCVSGLAGGWVEEGELL